MMQRLLKQRIDRRVFGESSKNSHQSDCCQRQQKASDVASTFHLDAPYRVNKPELFMLRINTLIQLPNAHDRRGVA